MNFLAQLALDAARCLDLERSRAASPVQALTAWARGQALRAQRWHRMGQREFARLLAAECACAPVGLTFPRQDLGQVAPWHLPERWQHMPLADLPPHPVIDSAWLAAQPAWLQQAAGRPGATQGLMWLAQSGERPALWADMPLHAHGRAVPTQARVAVCLHLFYPELWQDLRAQLDSIPEAWDLYVSIPAFAATPLWQDIARDHPAVRFMPVANRGRDVAPFLAWVRSGVLDGYDAVCKLHGKRSLHMEGGDAWRVALVSALLGSTANVAAILARLRGDPGLAMLGPTHAWRRLSEAAGWAKNRVRVGRLAQRLGLAPVADDASFFAGTMFWFKPAALRLLRDSDLTILDFPIEMGQTEGTLAHALERLMPSVVHAVGGRVQAWPQPDTLKSEQ